MQRRTALVHYTLIAFAKIPLSLFAIHNIFKEIENIILVHEIWRL
jgi:hypothetical protein